MRNRLIRSRRVLRAVMALGGPLLFTFCGIVGPDLDEVGTITLTAVGCWGIQTSAKLYEPNALAEEFRVEGLRVRFEGDIQDDAATLCSIGPVVKITRIERVGS